MTGKCSSGYTERAVSLSLLHPTTPSLHHSTTPFLRFYIFCAGLVLAFMAAAAGGAEPPPLLARLTPDRSAIYEGEQFTLMLAIYVRDMNLDRQVSIGGLPPADRLQIEPFAELPVEYATIGQQIYEARRWRCAARAAQPGPLSIQLALDGRLVTTIQQFFFTQREVRPVKIPVEPLALDILPLPAADRPAGFSGVVGRDIALTASINPADVAVGDLITFTTLIQGAGLPLDLKAPLVNAAADFKTYPPKAVPATAKDLRQFEQIFIPLASNAAALGPVSFTYFDTATKSYVKRVKGPFPIKFHPEKQPDGKFYRAPTVTAAGKETLAIELRPWRGNGGKSGEIRAMFDRAAELAKTGGFREATDIYARLISSGVNDIPVFFNLSQVQFAGGQLDQAVLNLRRAMRRAPGDKDLHAASDRALVAAHAIAPAADPGLIRFALAFTPGMWKLALVAGLLLLVAGLILARRRLFEATRAIVFIGLLLIGSGMAALAAWSCFEGRQEAVIVETQATALLAPAETARPLARLLPGSVVLITERHAQWARVECDGISGWVPLSAIALVE